MPAYPNQTPPHNTTGAYVLRAPFSATGLVLRAESIRSFNEVEDQGISVYDHHYHTHGLDSAQYVQDRNDRQTIVTLMSSNGRTRIDVPSSFIITYPGGISVPHGQAFLVLNVGILPIGFDVSAVLTDLKEIAEKRIGNPTTTTVMSLPTEGFVSQRESETMNQARMGRRSQTQSNYAKALAVGVENDELKREVGIKDAMIVSLTNALSNQTP